MLNSDQRINTKSDLKEWLNYELPRYDGKIRGNILRKIIPFTEGDLLKKHQILLRKSEYYTNANKKIRSLLYRSLLFRLQNKYSIHVPLNCCSKGLKIMHVGPVIINPNSTIGENCSIHMNVGIVAGGKDNGAPTIDDNVVIGIGAIILGDVYVSYDSAIGANSVVNKSFYENSIAIAGVPAKKISNNGRGKWNSKEKNEDIKNE